jgi:hypothetical protein
VVLRVGFAAAGRFLCLARRRPKAGVLQRRRRRQCCSGGGGGGGGGDLTRLAGWLVGQTAADCTGCARSRGSVGGLLRLGGTCPGLAWPAGRGA